MRSVLAALEDNEAFVSIGQLPDPQKVAAIVTEAYEHFRSNPVGRTPALQSDCATHLVDEPSHHPQPKSAAMSNRRSVIFGEEHSPRRFRQAGAAIAHLDKQEGPFTARLKYDLSSGGVAWHAFSNRFSTTWRTTEGDTEISS